MKAIVAVDSDWGIGYRGQMLFQIPEDLAYFAAHTRGQVIVMGRKTLGSLPNGRPLPDRLNLVLSRQPGWQIEGAQVYSTLERILPVLQELEKRRQVFIIGGEEVYRQFLPYCDVALVTHIDGHSRADSFFPNLLADPGWKVWRGQQQRSKCGQVFRFDQYMRVKGEKLP